MSETPFEGKNGPDRKERLEHELAQLFLEIYWFFDLRRKDLDATKAAYKETEILQAKIVQLRIQEFELRQRDRDLTAQYDELTAQPDSPERDDALDQTVLKINEVLRGLFKIGTDILSLYEQIETRHHDMLATAGDVDGSDAILRLKFSRIEEIQAELKGL